jgi:uncharacterized glyoxalase superfamily protein PhnB
MSAAAPGWMAPGRSRVAAFLIVPEPDRVIAFAERVFGATRRAAPIRKGDGRLWNAEINIGESTVMLSEADPGGMTRPGFLYVQVPDADAAYARALEEGARAIQPPEDRFYGARDGGVEDMAGNWWWISTRREDLTEDEIAARARAEEARRATEGTAER